MNGNFKDKISFLVKLLDGASPHASYVEVLQYTIYIIGMIPARFLPENRASELTEIQIFLYLPSHGNNILVGRPYL